MNSKPNKLSVTVKEIAVFGMLGALMYSTKILMQFLPNIHLLGLFIVSTTVVYRVKALYPLYIYVLLDGIFSGFAIWWLPYIYIWTILWAVVMILPKNMPPKVAFVVYIVVCGLHGFLFGVMYAPAQALIYGLNFNGMITWIIAGLPFDVIHGVSNILAGFLIVPLSKLMIKINNSIRI